MVWNPQSWYVIYSAMIFLFYLKNKNLQYFYILLQILNIYLILASCNNWQKTERKYSNQQIFKQLLCLALAKLKEKGGKSVSTQVRLREMFYFGFWDSWVSFLIFGKVTEGQNVSGHPLPIHRLTAWIHLHSRNISTSWLL